MKAKTFRDTIRRFIESEAMLRADDKVVVALSGGADSVCLLLILKTLGYEVVAAHCNFHLRGSESMRDEEFVKNLCERMDVRLRQTDFDTTAYAQEKGVSIEVAARELRYNYFKQVIEEERCNALAVGHHKDDNAETFLLNCVRKTGIRGLGGIKPVSTNQQGCKVVRPLLCVCRQDITDYLEDCSEQWVTDSSNLKNDMSRNKMRLDVMPVLKEVNKGVVDNLCDTMQNVSEMTKIYEDWIEKEKKRCSRWTEDGTLVINRERLAQSASPISVLHELLSPLGFNETQVKNLLTAKGFHSNRQKGAYEMTLPGGQTVLLEVKWKEIRVGEMIKNSK
jgi:tRNA(Ile)-lysidine synthase